MFFWERGGLRQRSLLPNPANDQRLWTDDRLPAAPVRIASTTKSRIKVKGRGQECPRHTITHQRPLPSLNCDVTTAALTVDFKTEKAHTIFE